MNVMHRISPKQQRYWTQAAAEYGIIYSLKDNTILYRPTGRTYDLNLPHFDYLEGYIGDWGTLDYMLYHMGKSD